MGGKDAASARYIFTKLEPIARTIFHPDDDALLNYLNDDGSTVEPQYYVPVIPMILVNGADGIGTGWSSAVSNFDPREIVANIRRKIASDPLKAMDPFYCGFTGEIKKESGGRYTVRGFIERVDDETLRITELPIKKWTQNYKEFLEAMMVADPKKPNKPIEIKDFRENHTETTVDFTIIAEKELIDEFEKDPKGLYGKFKLQTSISTSNMTLFDAEGKIVKYNTPEDILDAFYDIRLDFYGKRKEHLMKILAAEKLMLSNKARFVEEVCKGSLVVSNRRKKELLQELVDRKYDLISKDKKDDESSDTEEEEETSTAELALGYEYLLGMKIWSLTYEKAEDLRQKLSEKTEELETLRGTQPSQLWLNDLDAIEVALEARDCALQADKDDELRAQNKNKKRVKAGRAKTAKKKPKKGELDSDMDEDSDEDFFVRETKAKKNVAPTKKIVVKKPVSKAAASTIKESCKRAMPKQPAKAKPSVATNENPMSLDDSSDDDFSLPLAQRLQKNLKLAPSSSFEKKRPSPRSDDTSDDELDFNELPAASKRDTKPPVSKKVRGAATTKNKTSKKSLLTGDDESVKNIASTGMKKQAVAKTKAKTTAKNDYSFSDDQHDESEVDLGDTSDEDVVVELSAKPQRATGRSGRAAAKAVYVFSSDEEGNDSD